jgi:hypothetical protein
MVMNAPPSSGVFSAIAARRASCFLVTGEDAMIVSKDRDEMHLLLMGEGDYYVRGRDDMGEPQDHIALWDKVLIPYTVMPFNAPHYTQLRCPARVP